ncbi:MAG TPA: hypothetical protein VM265_08435, partial [Sphingomicrobium sp.]|nr:hypothetical protein [Sphingomicrobium sp.]
PRPGLIPSTGSGAGRDPAAGPGHRRPGAFRARHAAADHADFADRLMASTPPQPDQPEEMPGELPDLPGEPEPPPAPDPVEGISPGRGENA